MAQDRSTIRAAVLHPRVVGNGHVPPQEGAPQLLAEVGRLTEECDALRQLATAHTAEMEHLSQRKDEFIAIASHDIKTPLTVILGYAQYAARLLAMPSPDLGKVGRMLAVVQNQGVMMTGLLEDFIDASRLQAEALEVRPTPCDIGPNLTAILSRLSSEERARVDVTVPPAAAEGQWDQQRIEQVLANLIGNALKYSPDDSRVTVVVTRHDGGIEVAVSDQGMGIPSNDLIRVFDRFHRTPQALASGRPGTGLGLYICRCIVAAHGGSLWAESPGEQLGATFRFTLPCQLPA
jgi:signal transduction histidine kinase